MPQEAHAASPEIGGYAGLLMRINEVRVLQANIQAIRETLEFADAAFEAAYIDIGSVYELRQVLASERRALLEAQVSFEDALDQLKTHQLGLPADEPVALDDSQLEPLQLDDPKIADLRSELSVLFGVFADNWRPDGDSPAEADEATLGRFHRRLVELLEEASVLLVQIAHNIEPASGRPRESGRVDIADRFGRLQDDFAELRSGLAGRSFLRTPTTLLRHTQSLQSLLDELALIRACSRLEALAVPRVDISPSAAAEMARANRLDWPARDPGEAWEQAWKTSIRKLLRGLAQEQITFELHRSAAATAVTRLDYMQLRMEEPPRPGARPSLSPALVPKIGDSLLGLRNAKQALARSWFRHFAARRRLLRDLGLLELDEDGVWTGGGIEFLAEPLPEPMTPEAILPMPGPLPEPPGPPAPVPSVEAPLAPAPACLLMRTVRGW
ncbi:MAG: hypothetical protein HQ582_03915 [Planctomycetes bacterium]|nr:hypothetical protein [Planctomycetota bacterium]